MARQFADETTWNGIDRMHDELHRRWLQTPDGMASARRAALIDARTDTYLTEELRGQHERVNAAMADIAPIIDRLAGEDGVGREFGFGCRDRLRAIDTAAAKRRAKARAEADADRIDFTCMENAR